MKKLSNKSNSGQALLVILLIMAVVLTIGLSTISRSVTDIKISEQTEDSARAFSAAEAGIEAFLSSTLITDTSSLYNPSTGMKVDTSRTLLGAGGTTFLYPEQLTKNEVATIWLSEYNKTTGVYSNYLTPTAPNKAITVAWGNPGTGAVDSNTPAIEVTIYYKDNSGNIKTAKYLLDPAGVAIRNNGFCKKPDLSGSCTGISWRNGEVYGGQSIRYSANITVGGLNNMYFARLRLLYNNTAHYLGFGSFALLPSQGEKIAAVGTSNQATRKVEVKRLNSAPPDIFDFALYSGGSLVK